MSLPPTPTQSRHYLKNFLFFIFISYLIVIFRSVLPIAKFPVEFTPMTQVKLNFYSFMF